MKKILIGLLVLVLVSCDTDKVKRDRFFLQGNEALGSNEYDEAIEYYTRALEIDRNYSLAYNNRGVARIEDDHPYQAIQDYNMAISIDPEYHEAVFNRAYAYEQVGRIEDALDDMMLLEKQYEDSAYVHFYKGLLLTRLRSYDEALSSFRQSIQLEPANVEAKVNIATLYYLKGDLTAAKEKLKLILEDRPNETNALNTLSQVYLDEEDLQNALLLINRALQIIPDEPYFLNNRGLVYLKMKDMDRALDDINRSILLDPNNAWAYRNKGIYYLEQEKPQRALEQFRRASDEEVFIDQLHFYIGQAYWMLEQKDQACENWDKALQLNEKGAKQMIDQYCG